MAKFDSKFFKLCIVLAAFSVFLIFFSSITLSIDRAILSVTILDRVVPVMRAISVSSSEREPLPLGRMLVCSMPYSLVLVRF